MYNVSEAYRRASQASIRNPAHIKVAFGLMDNTARQEAMLSAADILSWASAENVNADSASFAQYATFEGDRWRLDGTQLLTPEPTAGASRQGYISKSVSDADGVFATPPVLRVDFPQEHTMVGLSFDFGGEPPAQITVLSYAGGSLLTEQTVAEGITDIWRHEFLLENVERIDIRFDRTVKPYNRARLATLAFGIGYVFDETSIMELTEKRTSDPINSKLPTGTLTFAVYNDDGRFDVDGDTALVRFLTDGQAVDVNYGLETDAGVEYVPSMGWKLESWDVDGIKASFTCYDVMKPLTAKKYERGALKLSAAAQTEELTVYDVMVDILEDAGVSDYYVADYLRKCYLQNPIPLVSHAEAIQLVGQAFGAHLSVDRYGRPIIDSVFRTPILTPSAVEASGGTPLPYSDAASTLEASPCVYATFEQDFLRLDGGQILQPDSGHHKTGFVSRAVSGPGCTFAGDTGVLYDFDNRSSVASITIDFGLMVPRTLRIMGDDVARIYHPTTNVQRFDVSFNRIRALGIYIDETQAPGQRAHISHVALIGNYSFVLGRRDVYGNVKGELALQARDVIVTQTKYNRSAEVSELATIEDAPIGQLLRVEHGQDPAYDVTVETPEGVTATLTSYAYVSYILLAGPGATASIKLLGRKAVVSETSASVHVHDNGEDCGVANVLVDAQTGATVAQYYADFFARREKFPLEIRGYPELEPLDIINLWEADNPYIVLEIETKYNGAYRGNILLRRTKGYQTQ